MMMKPVHNCNERLQAVLQAGLGARRAWGWKCRQPVRNLWTTPGPHVLHRLVHSHPVSCRISLCQSSLSVPSLNRRALTARQAWMTVV